ncbi:MAG TPA: isoprenylcysteine carboxylmethyltransferase family protein [Candidatus Acidoferrales bacterium]
MAERPEYTAWILVKLALFTLIVPGTVTVWLPWYLYRGQLDTSRLGWNVWTLAGGALLALGIAGYLWTSLDFALRGRGTPAPIDPPRRLVVRGLYRYVRNPMYVSVALVIAGQAVALRLWALFGYMALCWVIVHLWVLLYEEPVLRAKFGDEYEDYCRRVPRWIPRFQPHA